MEFSVGYLSVRVKEEIVNEYSSIYPNYNELVISVSPPYVDPFNPAQRKVTIVYGQVATTGYLAEKERLDLEAEINRLQEQVNNNHSQVEAFKIENKRVENLLHEITQSRTSSEHTVLNCLVKFISKPTA